MDKDNIPDEIDAKQVKKGATPDSSASKFAENKQENTPKTIYDPDSPMDEAGKMPTRKPTKPARTSYFCSSNSPPTNREQDNARNPTPPPSQESNSPGTQAGPTGQFPSPTDLDDYTPIYIETTIDERSMTSASKYHYKSPQKSCSYFKQHRVIVGKRRNTRIRSGSSDDSSGSSLFGTSPRYSPGFKHEYFPHMIESDEDGCMKTEAKRCLFEPVDSLNSFLDNIQRISVKDSLDDQPNPNLDTVTIDSKPFHDLRNIERTTGFLADVINNAVISSESEHSDYPRTSDDETNPARSTCTSPNTQQGPSDLQQGSPHLQQDSRHLQQDSRHLQQGSPLLQQSSIHPQQGSAKPPKEFSVSQDGSSKLQPESKVTQKLCPKRQCLASEEFDESDNTSRCLKRLKQNQSESQIELERPKSSKRGRE